MRLGHGSGRTGPEWTQHFVTLQPMVPVMSAQSAQVNLSSTPLWLVRPRSDGGSDYVSFMPALVAPAGALVEIRLGSHLPPQMPLLKRRLKLAPAEAEACCHRLQQEDGYQRSEPLF